MARPIRPLLALIPALALLIQASGAWSQEPAPPAVAGPVVRDIRVQGNKRVSEDDIRMAIATKVGQPYEGSRIAFDVRTLYQLGYFNDIQVDKSSIGDGALFG